MTWQLISIAIPTYLLVCAIALGLCKAASAGDQQNAAALSREAPTPHKETAPSASPQPSSPHWCWPPQPGLPPSLNYTTAQIGNNE